LPKMIKLIFLFTLLILLVNTNEGEPPSEPAKAEIVVEENTAEIEGEPIGSSVAPESPKENSLEPEEEQIDPHPGKIGWGIIGLGTISRKLAFAINESEDGYLRMAASRNPEKAKAFAEEFGADKSGTYEEVLKDPFVKVVYVPLPTALETRWVLLACKAGKNVLADKPFVNAQAAHQMVDACAKNNVQFMDATMFMHHSRTKAIRKLLQGKQIFSSHAVFNLKGPARESGNIRLNPKLEPLGALGDLGWYVIRMSLIATNFHLPEHVYCIGKREKGVIMEMVGTLMFAHHIGTFSSRFQSAHAQHADIYTDEGVITIPQFVIPSFSGSEYKIVNGSWTEYGSAADSKIEKFGPEKQVVNLVNKMNAIVKGGKNEGFWADIAIKTMQVMDACLRSFETKRVVDVQKPSRWRRPHEKSKRGDSWASSWGKRSPKGPASGSGDPWKKKEL